MAFIQQSCAVWDCLQTLVLAVTSCPLRECLKQHPEASLTSPGPNLQRGRCRIWFWGLTRLGWAQTSCQLQGQRCLLLWGVSHVLRAGGHSSAVSPKTCREAQDQPHQLIGVEGQRMEWSWSLQVQIFWILSLVHWLIFSGANQMEIEVSTSPKMVCQQTRVVSSWWLWIVVSGWHSSPFCYGWEISLSTHISPLKVHLLILPG